MFGVGDPDDQVLVVTQVVSVDGARTLARPERERSRTGHDHGAADAEFDSLRGVADRRYRAASLDGILQDDVLAFAGTGERADGGIHVAHFVEALGGLVPDDQLVGVGQAVLVWADVDRHLALGAVEHEGVGVRGKNEITISLCHCFGHCTSRY